MNFPYVICGYNKLFLFISLKKTIWFNQDFELRICSGSSVPVRSDETSLLPEPRSVVVILDCWPLWWKLIHQFWDIVVETGFTAIFMLSSVLYTAAAIPTPGHGKTIYWILMIPLKFLFNTSGNALPSPATDKILGVFLIWELEPFNWTLLFTSPVNFI